MKLYYNPQSRAVIAKWMLEAYVDRLLARPAAMKIGNCFTSARRFNRKCGRVVIRQSKI